MKRILICLLMICTSVSMLLAQSTQQVVVQEYQQKQQKTPLGGVSLTVQNAGSSMSDAQGALTLQFRSLKAGDPVQVRRVDLSGYEVFNKEAVDQWTISPQQAFTLVLCKSDRFKALRDQYLRASSASYERQYRKDQARLEALRKENKLKEEEYQQQLQELEDNYYEQLDNLDNYVDRFARIDLSEVGAQEQRIIDLVQEGNMDEAVRLYESGDYLGKYQAQVRDIQEIDRAQARLAQIEAEKIAAREQLYASIDRQVQVYQLAGGQENWQKIFALLKGVADADTTNVKAVFNYASHIVLENYEEHEKYALMALRHCQENDPLKTSIHYSLATQYVGQAEIDEAENHLLKAIEEGEKQNRKDALLIAKSYLHSFYCYLEEYEQAEALSASLYALIDTVAAYWENEAEVWIEKANLDVETAQIAVVHNDFELAEKKIASAYQLGQKYKDADGIYSLQSFADLLTKIVFVYEAAERPDLQEKYMKEQVGLYEALYEQRPSGFMENLFEGYNNLSDNLVSAQRLDEARPYLDKAQRLADILETNYSSSASIYLMVFYDTMAHYWELQGDATNTKEYATKCMSHFQKLPAELQESYEEVKNYWNNQ